MQPVLDGGYHVFGGRLDEHVQREANTRYIGAFKILELVQPNSTRADAVSQNTLRSVLTSMSCSSWSFGIISAQYM